MNHRYLLLFRRALPGRGVQRELPSTLTPQKLRSLSRGSINDAKSQLGCFPLELFDL